MIAEDYCFYEVAKLLKEKGFDEKTLSYYEDNVLCHGDWFEWNRSPLGHISAPTHQMAMKWLREVHGLHIEIGNGDLDYWYVVDDVINRDENHYPITKANYEGYKTNEEAVEAALKYSLENLI